MNCCSYLFFMDIEGLHEEIMVPPMISELLPEENGHMATNRIYFFLPLSRANIPTMESSSIPSSGKGSDKAVELNEISIGDC